MQALDGMTLGASRFSAYRSLLYLAERVVGEVWTFCWELDLPGVDCVEPLESY
jgi:hypothetical protein